MPRRLLTVKQKIEVLNELNINSNQKDLAEKYNVSISTISRIKNSEDEIRSTRNLYKRRHRKSKYANLDIALRSWFNKTRSENGIVSGTVLLAKAQEFAATLKEDYEPDRSWMQRWCSRNGINLAKIRRENYTAAKLGTRFFFAGESGLLPSLPNQHEKSVNESPNRYAIDQQNNDGESELRSNDPISTAEDLTDYSMQYIKEEPLGDLAADYTDNSTDESVDNFKDESNECLTSEAANDKDDRTNSLLLRLLEEVQSLRQEVKEVKQLLTNHTGLSKNAVRTNEEMSAYSSAGSNMHSKSQYNDQMWKEQPSSSRSCYFMPNQPIEKSGR